LTTQGKGRTRVRITLPVPLVEYLDVRAQELGLSRGELLARVLTDYACAERDRAAGEGYEFYADESRDFACCCLKPSSEVICRCS